jgi:pyruvate formate lyase activating enzyme
MMFTRKPGNFKKNDANCAVCGSGMTGVGSGIEVCPDCVRGRWKDCRARLEAIHAGSRRIFDLPLRAPRDPDGFSCNLCHQRCRIGQADTGYCGIRSGSSTSIHNDGRSHARLSFYYDPLPTNCVADWVCPGGTGAGYPKFANDRCTEVGYYNLAVFFEACNFNCLYCQNWSFKKATGSRQAWHSVNSLTGAVTDRTSCICFFGGDPTPQLPYALLVSEAARRDRPEGILRICWETNGSMDPVWLERMARISMETGGCIKVDLKAWDPRIHRALCGCDNRRVLENFARLAEWVPRRPDPPLLVASTVMVPGFVGEEEVSNIASFIARLNPDIPYALLAFAPQFFMEDFPCTSRSQAEACMDAARRAGLRRVRLGNVHFVS